MQKIFIMFLKIIAILIVFIATSFLVSTIVYKYNWDKLIKSTDIQRINYIDDTNQDKKATKQDALLEDVLSDSLNSQIWLLAKANNTKSQNILDKIYFTDNFIGYVTVITSDGWLITNNPIKDQSNLVVVTNNNEIIPVDKIVKDPFINITYIKINKNNLEPIAIADPSTSSVGQNVYAIHPNLYNYQNEAIFNSIRNLHSRPISQKLDLIHKPNDLIVYGALKDFSVENMPIVNSNSQLIGFSVNLKDKPYFLTSKYIRNSMKNFFANNKIAYPSLGISYVDLSEVVLVSDMPKIGALVYEAPRTSQIKKNDIITSVNDDKINELRSLNQILLDYSVDSELTLTILRDKKEIKINVKPTILKLQ